MNPDFTKSPDGLVPAIIQDANTKTILMLAFMNKEAFEKTRKEGKVTFFSRSKKRLWTKGETSGNFLNVKSILLDCDSDTILIKAIPDGPACHTGSDTCFNEKNTGDFLQELQKIIADRKNNPSEKSYTSSLFKEGLNRMAQKVGEEATELIIEAKDNNAGLFKNEAADLIFHLLVLLEAKNVSLNDVIGVLEKRHK
jgi:phosphoribosyl-ATP pyrophosphohydrolase/phosphoribosyl-AMP cyclohydrolase